LRKAELSAGLIKMLAPKRKGLYSKARCHWDLTGWHLTLPDPDQTLLARAHHAKHAPRGAVSWTLAQFTTARSKQCRGNALAGESINRLVIHRELQRRAAPYGPIGPQGSICTRKGVRHKNKPKKVAFDSPGFAHQLKLTRLILLYTLNIRNLYL
jgi:hypothetical protein